jgi:hypothetical protein
MYNAKSKGVDGKIIDTKDGDVVQGLVGASMVLNLFAIIFAYFDFTAVYLPVGVIAFVLSIAGLARHEDVGNVKCSADSMAPYRYYMTCHILNIVLFFFTIMKVLS